MMPLDFLRSLRWQHGLDVVLAALLLDQLVLSVREIRALRALRLGGTPGGLSHVYGHAYWYRSEMTSECLGGRWRLVGWLYLLIRGAYGGPAAPSAGRPRHHDSGGLHAMLHDHAPAWALMAVAQPPV